METKKWFESKIVWVGLINTVIAILAIGGEFLQKAEFSPIAISAFITGVLTVVLRVWFTNTEITK